MRKLTNDELNRLSPQEFRTHPKNPLMVLLDDVRSMHNVGSAFRTCDAFLVERLYLCGITATPPHREINKTALGATETLDWEYHPDSFEQTRQLKNQGIDILAIEQADQSINLDLFQPDPSKKYCLVFGHEVKGVRPDIITTADACIEIPQFGTKHSLNIAVGIGVVVWDLLNKMQLIKKGT